MRILYGTIGLTMRLDMTIGRNPQESEPESHGGSGSSCTLTKPVTKLRDRLPTQERN